MLATWTQYMSMTDAWTLAERHHSLRVYTAVEIKHILSDSHL